MFSKLTSRVAPIHLPYLFETSLWIINLQSIQVEELTEAYQLLDKNCIRQIENSLYKGEQERAFIRYATTRIILGKAIGEDPKKVAILQDANNKPYLSDYPIHFNLSHTANFAFLAYHPDRELGVDIEKIEQDIDLKNMPNVFMSPKEIELLNHSSNPLEYFFIVWCGKEAYLKAIGIGFSEDQIPEFDSIKNLEDGVMQFNFKKISVLTYQNQVLDHVLAVCQL